VYINDPGTHQVTVSTIEGRTINVINGEGIRQYGLAEAVSAGIYFVEIRTPLGVMQGRFVKF
jgi:hypothetical protein